jgi:hypothetical protein
MIDVIAEDDLHAFVDDQLNIARRIEVEDYLSHHPEIAASVAADMRRRDALRLAFHRSPLRPSMQILEAARRLERALAWRWLTSRLQHIAAAAVLIWTGWIAHGQLGLFDIADSSASPKLPAFVEDAGRSREAEIVRARIAPYSSVFGYDPAEIAARTGITLPALPSQWRVIDAEIFPSRSGNSVEVAIDTDALGRLYLFAARTFDVGVVAPKVARSLANTTVYWQSGSLVYAITASATAPEAALEEAGSRLSGRLR